MVAVGGGVLVGRVTETVLGAKLFGDLVVDLSDVLFFLDFEETAAGLLGHAFEDLFAVDVVLARLVAACSAAIATAPGYPPPPPGSHRRDTASGIAATRVAAAG